MIGIGSGDLRQRVILEARDETSDGQGGLVLSEWRYVGAAWAEIRAVSTKERLQAAGELATVTHRVRLRWRSDITARMRVTLDESGRLRTFLLEGPPVDLGERHEILEFLATETA